MSSLTSSHWIAIVFIIIAVLIALRRASGKASMICRDCGHAGHSQLITRGSLIMEVLLWICFIIPGVIYSIWRISTRYDACNACGSSRIIPQNSPIGKKLLAQNAP